MRGIGRAVGEHRVRLSAGRAGIRNSWIGRRDAEYLRSWLNDQMRTAASGIPGYRPWDGAAQRD